MTWPTTPTPTPTTSPGDNVGGTIMAEDPNIGMPPAAERDSLAFSLSGDDESKFRLRERRRPMTE